MNFAESLQYLLALGHETLAIKFGLENTERLLSALGAPQRRYVKVQLAGTNGKGSSAVMLSSIASAAGIKTGLYTSPHLVDITERIRICGSQISEAEFARLTTKVRAEAERLVESGKLAALPTFFEQVTAIALLAFAEAGVELAILETGLGGRLDATTAAAAEIVAITPVAIDHQEYLGQTLSQIAAEKAAIIRHGVEAVIALQLPEALEVILKRCRECNVTPRLAEFKTSETSVDERGRLRLTFRTERDLYRDAHLNLAGRHQATNAFVAVGLAEALASRGFGITREAILRGLAGATHPGRLEWREGRPGWLFDGAHNAAGARALRAFLDEFVKARLTLVFGAMRDKELQEIADLLFPAAAQLILTGIDNPRAAMPETLAALAKRHSAEGRLTLCSTVAESLSEARRLTPPDGLICVTGSLYLIGEAQALLSNQQTPYEVYVI